MDTLKRLAAWLDDLEGYLSKSVMIASNFGEGFTVELISVLDDEDPVESEYVGFETSLDDAIINALEQGE